MRYSAIDRWLRELGHPARKCERLGHRPEAEERCIYRHPSREAGWPIRAVADEVTERRVICSRCNAPIEDWAETDCRHLSGLTMDGNRWRKLRKEGVLDAR